jgi:hypothetical protein
MTPAERLNELLNLARQHYGITTDGQLEHCIGIDASTISRMRNNKHMPKQALAILLILNTVIPGPLPVEELQPA